MTLVRNDAITLERNIHYCKNLRRLSRSTMYVVLHDGVVEDAVALLQGIGILAVDNFYFSLHHIDKLLTLMD